MSQPELIRIVAEHVYLGSVGAQKQIALKGKLSNDDFVSIADLLANGDVTFESWDEEVATVDAQGNVTGRSVGVAPVSVKHGSWETRVLVFVEATGIEIRHPVNSQGEVDPGGGVLQPGDFTVPKGAGSLRLTVLHSFSNGKMLKVHEKVARNIFRNSNSAVVTLGVGKVRGILTFGQAGKSTVTALSGPFSDTMEVTVAGENPVSISRIEIREQDFTLREGAEKELNVVVYFNDGKKSLGSNIVSGYHFTSGDNSIAEVGTFNGIVTGRNPGNTTVTVALGSHTDTAGVTVEPANLPPEGIITTPSLDVTRHVRAAIPLRGNATDPDGTVSHAYWSFAGKLPNLSGVEPGLVSFMEAGTYEVTFTVTDNDFATDPTPDTLTITILEEDVILEELEIAEENVQLPLGETVQLTVLGHYSDGSTHYLSESMSRTDYETTDPSTAEVSTDGLVTGVSLGTVLITAENEGVTDQVLVSVVEPQAVLESIAITNGDLRFEEASSTRQLQVMGYYSDGSGEDLTSEPETSFGSSDPSVASVSEAGIVTALSTGVAVITASSGGFEDSIEVTVDIAGVPAPEVSLRLQTDTINEGEVGRLFWSSGNATHVVIEPDIGTGLPEASFFTVRPKENTTYTVTAYGPGGTDTESETMEVVAAPFVSMEKVTKVGGGCWSAAVSGETVFIQNGGTVESVDISQPSLPEFLGRIELTGTIGSVVVSGNYLCASDDAGLHVIDVSDPSNMSRVGGVAGFRRGTRLAVSNGFVYAAADYCGLWIIDVSDPADPLPAGHFCPEGWRAYDVAVSGDSAVVTGYVSRGSKGLWVLDISDPRSPVQAGILETGISSAEIALSDSTGYLALQNEGLLVVDLSDPANPVPRGSITSDWPIHHVSCDGQTVYASDMRNKLFVVDAGNLDLPVVKSSLELGYECRETVLKDDLAFLAAEELEIVNVAGVKPNILASYPTIHGIRTLEGGYDSVYAGGSTGLSVINCEDPESPGPVVHWTGNETIDPHIHDIAIGDNTSGQHYIYAVDGDDGLLIFNASGTDLVGNLSYPRQYVYLGGTEGVTVLRTKYLADDLVVPQSGSVIVTYVSKDAAYVNEFWLEEPRSERIFVATDANVGSTYNLGVFEEGAELRFALKNPRGWTFYTDPALNNDANYDHVILKEIDELTWEIYWEDTAFLRLLDYKDVVVRIEIVP